MDAAALSSAFGAYVLFIELERAVALRATSLGTPVLAPGRYAYCGSAHGPGGLKARISRHLRRGKAPHWHVDHLTAAGRIVALGLAPGGSECALVEGLGGQAGIDVPLAGFGSSDCRRCRAHLLRLARGLDDRTLACDLELVWIGGKPV
ncbi:MAG: GIY-YIG nuclease family protein [Kiloniellales bacterium]|nr:GIY-YIG nuclease family protein [Kiloniellales bacterium]